MRYFKITDPAALAAWEQYCSDVDAMTAEGRAFAERLAPGRAKAWYTTGPQRSVAGFSFSPPMTAPEWTKPERQNLIQRPRAKVAPAAKQALSDLNAIWKDYPTQVADLEPVLKTFGFSWGFFYGYTMFAQDGALYFATGDGAQQISGEEILGSEFAAAEAAHGAKKKTPQPA